MSDEQEVNHVPLSDIKPDLMNANRHTERGTYQLRNSMQKFGFAEAGTLDANNRIIAGNNRTEVAVDVLDPESVRVIEHDGKTPIYIKLPHVDLETVEGRELAIALNRTAQTGIEFDPDMLRQLDDMGVELGDWFTDLELDDMGIDIDEPEPAEDAGADVDKAAELQEQWGTELGQLWVLPSRDGKGEHRLLIGDCTDPEQIDILMGDSRAIATVTDPPYGVGIDYDSFDDSETSTIDLINNFMPIAMNFKPIIMTCGVPMMWNYPRPSWVMSWVHPATTSSCPWGFAGFNPILVYGKDPYLTNGMGRSPTHIVQVADRKGEGDHPVSKPLSIAEWMITRVSVNKGDIIYEPFAGSGTTIIACENLNRYCRAMELSPAYCAVILNRYAQTFGVSPYLSS